MSPPPCSFAHNNTGKRPCTTPGVVCPDFVRCPGRMGICKRCDKTVGEHACGMKLVLTKQGGVWTDNVGTILKRWLWDPRRQGAGTQPTEPIAFPLNDFLTFEYRDRWVVSQECVPECFDECVSHLTMSWRVLLQLEAYAFQCGETNLRVTTVFVVRARIGFRVVVTVGVLCTAAVTGFQGGGWGGGGHGGKYELAVKLVHVVGQFCSNFPS